ncbi:MAG TPA: hypothetical protein VFU04_00445 [Solirubrobacterales bacterium]|nr:hypothetical protein [Solirubrobacterales bacterium]
MREGTRTALLVEGRVHEVFVKRVVAAAAEAPPQERVRAGLEAAIAIAETDPAATRTALGELRADPEAMRKLESCLGGSEEEATLGLGAAIQVAISELDSPRPDLGDRIPELRRWLERDW